MVRTDVYSYINYSGLSYCPSAKECRRVCANSPAFAGAHSPLKNYRLIAHIVAVGAVFLGGWFLQRAQMDNYDAWNYGIYVVVILMIVTWFVSIFSDSAEALQTSFFVEKLTQPEYALMQGLHPRFREDLEHREKKALKDGNC